MLDIHKMTDACIREAKRSDRGDHAAIEDVIDLELDFELVIEGLIDDYLTEFAADHDAKAEREARSAIEAHYEKATSAIQEKGKLEKLTALYSRKYAPGTLAGWGRFVVNHKDTPAEEIEDEFFRFCRGIGK